MKTCKKDCADTDCPNQGISSEEVHETCFKEKQQSPQAAPEAGSECMNLLSGKLTHIAANLLRARLSDIEDDYPKKFPKHVLRTIEKHNECIRRLACELIDIKRAI